MRLRLTAALVAAFLAFPALAGQSVTITDRAGGTLTPFIGGKLPVTDYAHQLFVDLFDAGQALNTTDLWAAPVSSGGGVAAALASGNLTLGTGTTGNGYSYLLSQPAFKSTTPGELRFANNIAIESPVGLAGVRAWGGMSISGTAPTTAAPLGSTGSGAVFEIGVDGKLYAAMYQGGTRSQVADLSVPVWSTDVKGNARYVAPQPADALQHNFQIFYRPVGVTWYVDQVLVGTSTLAQSNAAVETLASGYVAVAAAAPPAGSLVLTSDAVSVSDTAKNNVTISDPLFSFRRAEVFRPAGTLDGMIQGAQRFARKGKVLYDGTTTTLAVASPVLDLTGIEELYFVVANGDAATRALTMDTFLDDGSTNVDAAFALFATTAAAKSRGTIGRSSTGALGTPAINFSLPISIPTKAQFTVAAGTTSARLTIWGK